MTTNLYFDTEFVEDGSTIDLLSIAICNDKDAKELYLFNADAKLHKASSWVQQNVFPSLPICACTTTMVAHWDKTNVDVMGLSVLAQRVTAYILSYGDWPIVQLWADYAAYDHVALAQTVGGKMIDLPSGVPMYTNEFQTYENTVTNLFGLILEALYDKTQRGTKHDAMEDARWLRYRHQTLKEDAQQRAMTIALSYIRPDAGYQIGDGNVQSNHF